ncbi:MAG: protein kinase [Deltaproteobacteria bacterium]|nr:protein kinase [Deltaproteobacteria bacterium]
MKACPTCHQVLPDHAQFCPADGTALKSMDADPLVGTTIAGRYHLLERIGEGSSGTIYRAEHTTLRSKLALKLLHHQLSLDEAALERYRDEAATIAQIDSDHIVRVSDFGRSEDGRLFLAMEFLEGEPLAGALGRERKLTEAHALAVLQQVGEALTEAHTQGVIHSDLRPRNIFLARKKDKEVVKLLDLGVAKLTASGRGNASGTVDPRYMSPEQARGDALDERSDIYSLGIVAYEMLAGAPPFVGSGTFDVLTKHLEAQPVPLSAKVPNVSAHFAEAVGRALRKRPVERFATVERFLQALAGTAPVEEVPDHRPLNPSEPVPLLKPKDPAAKAKAGADASDAAQTLLGAGTSPAVPGGSGVHRLATGSGARPLPTAPPAGGSGVHRLQPAGQPLAAVSTDPSLRPTMVPDAAPRLQAVVTPRPVGELAPEVFSAQTLVPSAAHPEIEAIAARLKADKRASGPSLVHGVAAAGLAGPGSRTPHDPFSDGDVLGSQSGSWFAEGDAAEQALSRVGSKSAPLPAIYDGIEDEIPRRRISPGMVIGGVVAAAALGLGLFLAMKSGDESPKHKTSTKLVPGLTGGTGGTEAPKPEVAKPEPKKPEAAKPETTKPEPAKPETKKPEPKLAATKPEPIKPEPAKPETKKPEPKLAATKPEAKKPEAKKPEPKVAKPEPKVAKPEPATVKPKVSPGPRRDPEQARFHVRVGRQQLLKGGYGKAKEAFKTALDLDPRSAEAHGGLGEVAFEQGNYGGAVVHLKQAVRHNARSTKYLVMLGDAYFKQKRMKQAVDQYKKALKQDPNNGAAKAGLGAAVRKLSGG